MIERGRLIVSVNDSNTDNNNNNNDNNRYRVGDMYNRMKIEYIDQIDTFISDHLWKYQSEE